MLRCAADTETWSPAAAFNVQTGAGTLSFEISQFGILAIVGANTIYGDVNRDGVVNAVDIQLVINAVLGIPVQYKCDINKDDAVDAVDVQLVINVVLGL